MCQSVKVIKPTSSEVSRVTSEPSYIRYCLWNSHAWVPPCTSLHHNLHLTKSGTAPPSSTYHHHPVHGHRFGILLYWAVGGGHSANNQALCGPACAVTPREAVQQIRPGRRGIVLLAVPLHATHLFLPSSLSLALLHMLGRKGRVKLFWRPLYPHLCSLCWVVLRKASLTIKRKIL